MKCGEGEDLAPNTLGLAAYLTRQFFDATNHSLLACAVLPDRAVGTLGGAKIAKFFEFGFHPVHRAQAFQGSRRFLEFVGHPTYIDKQSVERCLFALDLGLVGGSGKWLSGWLRGDLCL